MDARPSAFGKLVLLIGPSGVGKSVIIKRLRVLHPELHIPRSATTRARRPGEGDEIYRFVTNEEFDRLIAEKKLIEWASIHGGIARSGTPIDEILPALEAGKTAVREVDVQGFEFYRHHEMFAGKNATYTLQSIFVLPESIAQLVDHIKKRAPITDEELTQRIHSMETEFTYADQCDARVLNREGEIENTVKEVEKLIL